MTRWTLQDCGAAARVISWGVSLMRQLPSPSGSAWLFALGTLGGPWIVVLRDVEEEARERLAEHMVELGQASDVSEAMTVLAAVPVDHAGVLW